MIALWYNGDAIEPAPFQDGRRRILRHVFPSISLDALTSADPADTFAAVKVEAYARNEIAKGVEISPPVWVHWTGDARRMLAREHSGPGRRRARPVPRGRWVQHPPRSRIVALLYLPDGQRVDRWHIDDVERWLYAKGIIDG
jgi:hypothetical protein